MRLALRPYADKVSTAVASVLKEEQYHAHEMLYAICNMTFRTSESSSTYATQGSSLISGLLENDSAGGDGKILRSGSRRLPDDPTMM